jgi:hypothetical protein
MISRPEETFQKNWLGKYFAGSPEAGFITGTGGKVAKGVYGFGKGIAKSPLTVGSLVYMGGKWLWPDGTPANENEIKSNFAKTKRTVGTSGAPGGGDPGMFLQPQGNQSGEGVTLSAEEKRKNQIQKYRDIMDIKGMNKKAAYDSLIAASQAINESGDFKGDIKSGKLINQIIQATSKQFDKPSKTKEAIDTLILQNELKKDLNKEENALANLVKQKQIQVYDKTLAGDSFIDVINERIKKGEVPTGNTLATILRTTEGIDAKVIPSSKLGEGQSEISFLKAQVDQAKKDGTFQPGAVVISSRVLIVDEAGNIKPYL